MERPGRPERRFDRLNEPELRFLLVDHVIMAMSLIESTRGVALLPAYAENFLPRSVTSRPLKGDAPTVELVLGYKKSNESSILKFLLSRLDEFVARVLKKPH